MAHNQTGIAIVIKAFLPTGKTLDETFNALSIVKTAHETGDYAPLLAAAKVEEVKTEQKTRRIEKETPDVPAEEDRAELPDRGRDRPGRKDRDRGDDLTNEAAE